jgi:Domain of unknown function (DUF4126)
MYFVAAVLGVAGRLDWIDAPSFLEQGWMIVVAAGLFVVEFVVDKIAWLDSGWDAVHTVLRPVAGAWLVTNVEVELDSTVLLAMTGGTLAISAHAAKASTRAAVNLSPEPASNVVVSLAEDGLVAAVMFLALAFPEVAAVVAIVLTVLSLLVAWVLFRVVHRATARLRRRPPDPGLDP